MKYEHIEPGIFHSRPNRFIAKVEIGGREETAHVKNTGRCRELLVPGAKVYLERSGNPDRKTKWDLIAVEKGERMINMDSQTSSAILPGSGRNIPMEIPGLTCMWRRTDRRS